jgi:hypothetical protein
MDYWTIPQQWWKRQSEEQWRAAVGATMRMNRTVPPSLYYRDLLDLADTLIVEGRPELAVIVAQMACEVVVEQTLTPLLQRKKPPGNFNVHGKARKAYKRLTHDPIDKQSFWNSYGTHAIRRHDVVHRGRRVSTAEAQESLAVARQFVDHVETVQNNLAGVATPTA